MNAAARLTAHASVCLLALALCGAEHAAEFDTDVMSVLTRSGCNAGACHGAAAGQAGFHLSLWGSDPSSDYDAIVRELEGRRINLARPERSLLVMKPTGLLDHKGGTPLESDGEGERILLAWIASGASREQQRTLVEFEVQPAETTLERVGDTCALSAKAVFSDGTSRDVTPWVVLSPQDTSAIDVNERGLATINRRGRHVLVARYLDRVVAVTLTVPLGETIVDISRERRENFIDDEVLDLLARLRLPPAAPAGEATFLRRVYLDLTGCLPNVDEQAAFHADESPNKRPLLVDRLLASDKFVTNWTLFWAKLLRIDSASMNMEGAQAMHGWLRDKVAANMPIDEFARALITAQGDSFQNAPACFARATSGPLEQAEHVSQIFLGARLRCANCHNHPLDRWTQDDYHGLAAVFARLERGRHVALGVRGEVIHPKSGEPAVPRLPGERFLTGTSDPRLELAAWLTSPDNPMFARAIVNRFWQALFGRGLVEPLDDFRGTNPATHPRLLDRLAADFVEHGYDQRHTLRLMATSAAYARAGIEPGMDELGGQYYAHAMARPLSSEVLLDAISDVTGVNESFENSYRGARAVELVDARAVSPALDVLGRCTAGAACAGSAGTGGLARRLHLLNGDLLNRRIQADDGRLRRLFAQNLSGSAIVDEFYRRALCRSPRENEQRFWESQFGSFDDPDSKLLALEDFLWSLLSSREFVNK